MKEYIDVVIKIMPSIIIIIWLLGIITDPTYNEESRNINEINILNNSIIFIVSLLITIGLSKLNQENNDIYTTLSLISVIITSMETAKYFTCSLLGVMISHLAYILIHKKNEDDLHKYKN